MVVVIVSKLLIAMGFTKGKSEADRLIKQGAVDIDGKRVSFLAEVEDGSIVKVGKHRWGRVVNTDDRVN